MLSELKYYAAGAGDVAQLYLAYVQLGFDPQQCRKPGMVARACDLNTWNIEAGRSLQGHPLQHPEFKDSLSRI